MCHIKFMLLTEFCCSFGFHFLRIVNLLFHLQCLRLTEEQLAEREVDVIDIAFDELDDKSFKMEKVRH